MRRLVQCLKKLSVSSFGYYRNRSIASFTAALRAKIIAGNLLQLIAPVEAPGIGNRSQYLGRNMRSKTGDQDPIFKS